MYGLLAMSSSRQKVVPLLTNVLFPIWTLLGWNVWRGSDRIWGVSASTEEIPKYIAEASLQNTSWDGGKRFSSWILVGEAEILMD